MSNWYGKGPLEVPLTQQGISVEEVQAEYTRLLNEHRFMNKPVRAPHVCVYCHEPVRGGHCACV